MNDIKKVLIAAICVVLAVAIAAGVSIGVLAGTVNGMKDQIAELNQTVDALESQNSAMKAEIEEAAKNNEGLVSAAEFEAKLAEALGAQTQTMQAMISTAVKNQIEELGVEGLTEAQVQTIIDAAVANCLTEDDIDAIVANANTGLTKDEVKKLITDYTAGYLTYGQIVNLIEDETYALRAFLEKSITQIKNELQGSIDNKTSAIYIDAEDVEGDTFTINDDVIENLVGEGLIELIGDWSEINLVINYTAEKGITVWTGDVVATLDNKVSGKAYFMGGILTATVSSVAEIEEALNNVIEIIIASDLEWTLEDDVYLNEKQHILIAEDAEVVIDLGENEIVGNIVKGEGHVIENYGELTLIDGTVRSVAEDGASAVYNKGTLSVIGGTYEGAPKGTDFPSYVFNNYGTMTIKDATVTGNHGAIAVNSGSAVVDNVTATVNGIGGSAHVFYVGGELTINSGVYTHNGNTDGSVIYTYSNGAVVINGGTFSASNGGYGPAVSGANTSLTINGGTLNTGLLNWGGKISVTGGTFANDPTSYLADGYATQDKDGKYVVIPEDMVGATIISNAAELLALSAKEISGTLYIDADIDMDGAEFSAIIAPRSGSLVVVGNGHTISNVKVVSGNGDNTTGQASMFYCFPNSTLEISNVTFENLTVVTDENDSGYGAAVIGYCEGSATLNNVDVVNADVTGTKSSGMLVGHLSAGASLVATDCDVDGKITIAAMDSEPNGHYAGKYIGTIAATATLTDCTADVTIGGNLHANNVGDVFGRNLGTLN